jgi:hypothetical protein
MVFPEDARDRHELPCKGFSQNHTEQVKKQGKGLSREQKYPLTSFVLGTFSHHKI